MFCAFAGAVFDWRTGHIPHKFTLAVLLLSPLLHLGFGIVRLKLPPAQVFPEAGYCLLGAVLCSLVPLFLHRQNAIGGGDVALFAALGALLHPTLGVEAEMYSFFAAAVVAPAKLAYDGKLFQTMRNAGTLFLNSMTPKAKHRAIDATTMTWFRLGPCIFIGTVLTAFLRWRE